MRGASHRISAHRKRFRGPWCRGVRMSRWRSLGLLAPGLLVAALAGSRGVAATALTPGQVATDELFGLVLLFALAIGILVQVLIVVAVLRFRKTKGRSAGVANPKTHDAKLEAAWTIVPALILLVVGIATFQTLAVTDTVPEDADVTVYVIARQFQWEFHVLNETGVWTNTTTEFTVKVGQTVKILLVSEDVAHSLYIPDFRLKIDALPGTTNVNWFQAMEAGDFEIHCAEFCGVSHYTMAGMLHVVP